MYAWSLWTRTTHVGLQQRQGVSIDVFQQSGGHQIAQLVILTSHLNLF